MTQLVLQAEPREITGKKVKVLRKEGFIPGILYGSSVEAVALKFNKHEIDNIVARAGSSTLVEVRVTGHKTPYSVIVRDVQRDVFKQFVTHVDLQALSMTETVRLPISVILTGTAPAAEDLGGVLIQQVTEIDVECLPSALVSSIEMDISVLKEIGDSLSVKDLNVPAGIEVLTDAEETIVQVSYAEEESIEEEVEGFEMIGEAEEVEVIGKGKTEEEQIED